MRVVSGALFEIPLFPERASPSVRAATSGTYPLLSTDFVILSRLEQPLFPAPAVAKHIHYYRCTPRSGGRRAKRHGASAPASPPRHPPAPRVRPDVVHIRRSHRHRRPHRLCTQVRSMYHDHVALEADGSPLTHNQHPTAAPLAPGRAGAPNMWAMSPLIIDRMRCMPHVMSRNVQRTQACKQNRRHVSSFP
jgi:hypothetical protein